MQTFLPYSDFRRSLECLDYRRLGKQRVEAKQLLQALGVRNPEWKPLDKPSSWRKHPACKMWYGYEGALKLYHDLAIIEWQARGYKNNMPLFETYDNEDSYDFYPWWVGLNEFHASHRSNLLRKNYEHYSIYGWTEPDSLNYFWPVGLDKPGVLIYPTRR